MPVLPMFPLGTVLLPSMLLPLHVFEPRYRQLVRDCLAGDQEFGVVLIERGNEVGGGDTRTSAGTVARVLEVIELEDGRYALGAVGTRRIRVSGWLQDDPYPRAEVEDWPDPAPTEGCADQLRDTVAVLRRVLARRSELGDDVAAATHDLADDPVLASYQAVALSPIGPADRQRLLGAASPEDRLADLAALLAEEEDDLRWRLALEAHDQADIDPDTDPDTDPGPGPDTGPDV